MKLGNTTFTEEGLSTLTENQFREIYKGKLQVDMNEAIKLFRKYFKKDVQSSEEFSTKRKKVK